MKEAESKLGKRRCRHHQVKRGHEVIIGQTYDKRLREGNDKHVFRTTGPIWLAQVS
jgi:hypothetical protein